MAFATNGDLLQYVPTIFDHGVEGFDAEIALAETDVVRYIQINWFNKQFDAATFDADKLVDAQWNRATIYCALYAYILPQLATWRPEGDSFQEQIKFYKNRFNEEIEAEMAKGVEYDLDDDGNTSSNEVFHANRGKLWL